MSGTGVTPRPQGWLDALRVYAQARVLSMLFLGFSAGLPFYLVFNTLSAWLRQAGIQRSTIGMLSWVGILFSIKFLWAPIIDRMPPPIVHRFLGRRRGWMLIAQLGIAVSLFSLGLADPSAGVRPIALAALTAAFFAATQDIALDAWRIESAAVEMQGAMVAAYQVGYRIALIAGSAGALTLAGRFGWHVSYSTMAALVSVGLITTLLVREPHPSAARSVQEREARVVAWLERKAHWPETLRHTGEWFIGAVICPLVDFFARYGGALGLLLIAFIAVYRLTEFTMGSMVNPFYIDHGYTLDDIAMVVKIYGLLMAVVGVFIAGLLVAKVGVFRSLVLGSLLIMASNVGFALLASTHGPTLVGLGVVNGFDNLALAVHGTALIAFLSGLTSAKYTATQYALFSSIYALPGKVLEGFSGVLVDHIGYPTFFLYTASLSLPGLVLVFLLKRAQGISEPQATPGASGARAHARGA